MDSKGLVCASRSDLQPHKQPFAHDLPFQRTLLDAVHAFRPTALIGVSTVRGAFSQEVIEVSETTSGCVIMLAVDSRLCTVLSRHHDIPGIAAFSL